MSILVVPLADLLIVALFMVGIQQFRSPRGALRGNWIAAAALGLAVLAVGMRHEIVSPGLVGVLLLAGSAVGWASAARVSMVRTPALVALQNGAGALAAFLVCFVGLVRSAGGAGWAETLSGFVGLVLGAATLSGSILAAAKLADRFGRLPRTLGGHALWVRVTVAAIISVALLTGGASGPGLVLGLSLLVVLASVAGLLVGMRIGGADMPVLISFLNALAGMAAALAGVTVGSNLLVAAGATVAASGTVLTLAMCRAMNRSLLAVLGGSPGASPPAGPVVPGFPVPPEGARDGSTAEPRITPADGSTADAEREDPLDAAVEACRDARSVIFVPGYGMALAQAQQEVVELARRMEARGATIRFAVHPVAGRMPGHMHVLLSEAEAPWESLVELDINADFPETDLAIVVGASDVVNPAAVTLEGTPISGMPILNVHEAKRVLVVNLDDRPGYSGVQNLLYEMPQAILLWGDARETLRSLLAALATDREAAGTAAAP